MKKPGLHNAIIQTLREIEPRLKRFAVSVTAGMPSLRADIGLERLIPLSYMGEGMNRLLSIALAIPICQNGLLLIDELENGIHHAVLPRIFTCLHGLAEKFNVQLLATTHSWECIRAAYEIYPTSNVYDFRLFELENHNSQIQVVAYDRDSLAAKLAKKE